MWNFYGQRNEKMELGKLKGALFSATILIFPKLDGGFLLSTDALNRAMGALLFVKGIKRSRPM